MMKKLCVILALVVMVLSLLPFPTIAAEPVEIVSMRTEFSKTYDLGNGQYRFRTGNIIHWKYDYDDHNESWKEVDLTWKGNTINRAPYILTRDGTTITVTSRETGGRVTLQLTKVGNTDISSALEIGSARVASGVVGVDVQITPYADGVAFSRVLRDDKAVTEATYQMTQVGDGLTVRMDARDADGVPVPVQYTVSKGVITEWIDPADAAEAKYPITVDPTITPYSSTSDGQLRAADNVYATARTAAIASDLDDTGTTAVIGQYKSPVPPFYYVYKAFCFFDTSSIAAASVIESASFFVFGDVNNSIVDFDLVVQDGQPTYPHDPLEVGDYDMTHYSGSGGSFDTAGFIQPGYNEITLNDDGLGMITKEGTTKLCLRSSRDIDGDVPTTTPEYVSMQTADYAGTARDPYLSVTYYDSPTVTTNDATYVSDQSARLNGYATDDGGGTLDMRFQYDDDSDVSDGTATGWDSGFNTGNSHHEVVSSLDPTTQYWFRVQGRIGATIVSGSTLSFTTEATPLAPADLRLYTEDDRVVLAWTRGAATEGTEVRWKLGDYPTSTSDGNLLTRTEISSASHIDLDYGTTYYYMLWGYSGVDYTANNISGLMTTGPGETSAAITAPSTPSLWFTSTDYTRMSSMPLYSQLNDFYDSLLLPRATGWLLGAILISVVLGGAVLIKAKKPAAALVTIALSMVIMIFLRLMPGWTVVFVILFFLGASKMARPQEGGYRQ